MDQIPIIANVPDIIENGEVIDGKLPKRALSLVNEWYQLHKQELMEDWKLAELREPLKKIEPLE